MPTELDINAERAAFEAHESRRWPADLPCRAQNMATVYHWYMGQYTNDDTQRAFEAWIGARKLAPAAQQPLAKAHSCWACNRLYTLEQRADADGNCPHCGVEIELDDAQPDAGAACVPQPAAGSVPSNQPDELRKTLFRNIIQLGGFSKRLCSSEDCSDIPSKLKDIVAELHAVRAALAQSVKPVDLSAAGLSKMWQQAQEEATDTMPAPFQFARILLSVTPADVAAAVAAEAAASALRRCSKYGHRCNCVTDCVPA